MTKLVILIPARNEENALGEVIRRIPRSKLPELEVVVVNDGSTDNTAEVARKAGATVINFAKNRGLATVFRKGVEYAVESGADYIVNIDADGQHPPEQIPEILQPVLDGKADIVIGSRLMKTGEMKAKEKLYANKFLSKVISMLIHQKIYDSTSGFRAFTREVAKTVKIFHKYTYTQQQLLQAAYYKFKILEIPIPIIERKEGKSKLIKNIWSYAYSAINIIFLNLVYLYPFKFFSLFGLIFILSGVVLDTTFVGHSLLAAVLVLSGIMFVLFGALFELMQKYK